MARSNPKDSESSSLLTWLKTLLHHGNRDTVLTGQPIQQSMELLQLEVGTDKPLFSDDYETYQSLATDCWLKHVWRFQQEYDLQLKQETSVLTLQSTDDSFLISRFADAGFTGMSLLILNQRRRFYGRRLLLIWFKQAASNCAKVPGGVDATALGIHSTIGHVRNGQHIRSGIYGGGL
jgi:hypothetical protein